ncbi:YncE family protein [Rhodococcus sp. UNC23MFCrub1.1]|uniref:YncE family protein n=1 Tax=Rhodococcus sp. UNC23MFCrub1.1 TaxID=1449068 RepID=UPI0012DEE6A0|nr:hypothetical protein [Rhodococcus sp. UNC23MFCrub1.1]
MTIDASLVGVGSPNPSAEKGIGPSNVAVLTMVFKTNCATSPTTIMRRRSLCDQSVDAAVKWSFVRGSRRRSCDVVCDGRSPIRARGFLAHMRSNSFARSDGGEITTMLTSRTRRFTIVLATLTTALVVSALPAEAQPAMWSSGFESIALDRVGTPTLVAVSPDSNWVWVVDGDRKTAEVVDAHTRRTVGRWVTLPIPDPGAAQIRSLSVSVDDGWVAYVALTNGILRVNMHDLTVSAVISSQSTTAAVATAGDSLVRTTLVNGADIIDTRTGTSAPLDVSPVAVRPARSGDGRTAYVVGLTPPTLFPVDVRSKVVGKSWPIRVAGSGSTTKIAVSPSGRHVFTTDYGVGSILDTSTGVTTPVTGEAGRFLDVTYGPSDDVFYLADGRDLVRVEDGAVVDRVTSPGSGLHSPAYDSGTSTVFVAGATGQGLIAYTLSTASTPSVFGS